MTLKLTVVWPAGTFTVAGTEATVLFDDSDTTEPPDGAGDERTTNPIAVDPPVIGLGDTPIFDRPV